MSSEPISSPSVEAEYLASAGVSASDSSTSRKLSPRGAILNAAIVSLEYARQYLDKFLHWPDYILATHYYANVLALSGPQENHIEAEKCFKDVESWLRPAGKERRFDDARKRIRVEAMYNRAVLLAKMHRTKEARQELQSVMTLVGTDRREPPRGVRFAAEFALIEIDGEQIRDGSDMVADERGEVVNQDRQTGPDRTTEFKTKWLEAVVSFLQHATVEIQQLEKEIDSAESTASNLKTESKQIKQRMEMAKVNSSDAARYAKQLPESDVQHKSTQSRITKATKDLAILRMMETRVVELRTGLFANSENSPEIGNVPTES